MNPAFYISLCKMSSVIIDFKIKGIKLNLDVFIPEIEEIKEFVTEAKNRLVISKESSFDSNVK